MRGNDFCYLFVHCDLPPYELVWQISEASGVTFKCEERLFEVRDGIAQSGHVLYYYHGEGTLSKAWMLINRGTLSEGDHRLLFAVKPLPDYILIWEKSEEICYEDFWIPLFKQKGMSQMAYLYPDEKTTKITWCFDLPNLLP
jgi:hypothetical protein